jgi:hypothetical protein
MVNVPAPRGAGIGGAPGAAAATRAEAAGSHGGRLRRRRVEAGSRSTCIAGGQFRAACALRPSQADVIAGRHLPDGFT